jgi:hypothetical protein
MSRRSKPFAQSSAPSADDWMRGYRAGVVDAARDAGEMIDLPDPDAADDEASEPDAAPDETYVDESDDEDDE